MNFSGTKKIAMIVSIVGKERALPVLMKMPRHIVEEIDVAMKEMGTVVKPEALKIIKEFNNICDIIIGGGEKGSLLDVYDDARLSESPMEARKKKWVGLTKLSEQPVEKIYQMIKGESPLHQVIILKFMPESTGQEVFSLMSNEEKVAFTIESSTSMEPDDKVVSTINDVIEKRLESVFEVHRSNIEATLGYTDAMSEDELNTLLNSLPENLAKIIKENVVTFSDIINQNNKVVSAVLATIDAQTLAQACGNLNDSDIEKVKQCITSTKAEDFSYNLGELNKDDTSTLMAAQKKVVIKAKELQKMGEIELVK